ncbi:hypothetical protein [Pseudolysinimonas sp.]
MALYFLGRWATALIPASSELRPWVEWGLPLVPALLAAIFLFPLPRFEVRWHIDDYARDKGGYIDFDLARVKEATGAAEVGVAATLIPHYHSILGWALAVRAARQHYWVRVVLAPPGVMGVKQQDRATGAWVLRDRESFRLNILDPRNGKQSTRFSGSLVDKRLQKLDKVEFTATLRRGDGERARFLGTVSSSVDGIEVRS